MQAQPIKSRDSRTKSLNEPGYESHTDLSPQGIRFDFAAKEDGEGEGDRDNAAVITHNNFASWVFGSF